MTSFRSFKKILESKIFPFIFPFLLAVFFANPSLLALAIPAQWGQIQEQTQGQNGKTIVLIQEAHVNYEIQKSIAEILKSLVQTDSLRLVLVEGGSGDVDLSYFRHYADEKDRLEVAEHYLREGKISGEEYLDIVSDLNMELWGIENKNLYEQNLKAFLNLEDKKKHLNTELSKFERALKKLKAKIYSPSLVRLDKKRQRFEKDSLSLNAYLSDLAKINPDAIKEFPALQNLMSIMNKEGAYDSEKVEWERSALIRRLSNTLTKPELEKIKVLQNPKSHHEELALVRSLSELASAQTLKDMPNFSAYAKVLEGMEGFDSKNLFLELKKLETKTFDYLALHQEEKELLKIDRVFLLVRKLFELKLTPEEYGEFENDEAFSNLESYRPFFAGLRDNLIPNFSLLQSELPSAKRFYESALERENAMIQNAVKKIETSKKSFFALITGGFHTEPMITAFKQKGYAVVVISPRFVPTRDMDAHHAHYLKMLKEKWNPAAA